MALNFPARIRVSNVVPRLVMQRPTSTIRVVPSRGPRGPQGPPGDSSEVLGYRHTQSQPAMVVQVQHNLPYRPAGIVCTESDGYQLDYDTVAHPAAGITEISFGVLFSGTIDLS